MDFIVGQLGVGAGKRLSGELSITGLVLKANGRLKMLEMFCQS